MSGIDYFEGADEEAPKEPLTLERLTRLAAQAQQLEAIILDLTTQLATEQDKLDKILRGHIPEIFEALAIEEYKLLDGSKITVKDDIRCGISEERKPEAHGWLREHDYDGIIKTNVAVAFGKGEAELAEKARQVLIDAGFADASITDSVHHSTLKSFVKERLAAGDAIPIETFGVFEFKIAKITQPKRK